jgi:type IV pilus assembly protein PilE
MRKDAQHGFTLIELMITVAIVAILATIALPSYNQYIIKANRKAAQATMLDIAIREQQFLLANRAYASKAALEASGYALPDKVGSSYGYDVTVPTTASYLITFTPTPGTKQASDGPLTLNSEGVRTPADKW